MWDDVEQKYMMCGKVNIAGCKSMNDMDTKTILFASWVFKKLTEKRIPRAK